MRPIRTRFAPSPTGFQHLGGFRTAMYCWLLARHFDGKFILRIEDTDQERKVAGAIKYIIESLNWLGIDFDEGPSAQELKDVGEYWEGAPDISGPYGPYIQSHRKDIYREHVDKLIAEGKAYRCDCTSEMLEKERNEQMARRESPGYSGYCRTRNVPADKSHVVRFRLPDKILLTHEDLVRGKVVFENPPLRDPVLFKSDGFPTYHLASVVDDHLMQISHVFRGEEWLPTTPIHLLLYEAFGWDKPEFAHLSHILGNDGKKLSKRHGAEALNAYIEQGYLPEAILNFVSLIGWSPGEGNNQEIFTKAELIRAFSPAGFNKSGGVFDPAKLTWMNGLYLRSMSTADFADLAQKKIAERGWKFDRTSWDIIAPHIQERAKTVTEIAPQLEFLFNEKIERDWHEVIKKDEDRPVLKALLPKVLERLNGLTDFSAAGVDSELKTLMHELNIKPGQFLLPIRIAVTGKKATPPLMESIAALGREKVLARLNEAIGMI